MFVNQCYVFKGAPVGLYVSTDASYQYDKEAERVGFVTLLAQVYITYADYVLCYVQLF